MGVPTRSSHSEISFHDWTRICAGDEAGYTAPDPLHPEILFGDNVANALQCDHRRNAQRLAGAEPQRAIPQNLDACRWFSPKAIRARSISAINFCSDDFGRRKYLGRKSAPI